MSESTQASSPWGTAWHYVKRYWHWPVLLVVGVYVYQQYMPSIDLSTVEGQAPNVVAQTLDGETFRLREHRGEVVVVNVWATWCPPCRVEMPGFVDLQRALGDEGGNSWASPWTEREPRRCGPSSKITGLTFRRSPIRPWRRAPSRGRLCPGRTSSTSGAASDTATAGCC